MVGPDHAASKISLVLADVDGTLVTADKVLTPSARAAVKALDRAGIAFAITSGRPPRGMAMLIDPLALQTPIAGFNGGSFVEPDMTIMEEHMLAADVAARAVEVVLRHGMDVWVYSGKDWHVRDRNAPHVAREQWTVKFAPTVVATFDEVLGNAVKIVGVSDDHDLVARCEKDAEETLGKGASAARSGRQQGDRRHDAVETPVDSNPRDRHDRGHAERRADVSQQRPQHRDGKCQPGRAGSGRSGNGILRR
jgi:hydroxymethylpyrimidine pyrophosphatase-like HAD family hydrolase